MMIVYALLVASMIGLITIGMPVGFAAGVVSALGAGTLFGDLADPRVPSMMARLAYDKIDDFLLLAIPFFLLAGRLMNTGGITERLFGFVSLIVRPIKGGLGHANVLSSVVFAGMSGSATADAVGLGTIEMRAMLSQGYPREFSAGITAGTSLLSPILPPSIALVAYAVQAEQSVAAMFFAAVVPGVLMAASYMIYVAICAHRQGFPSGSFPGFGELSPAFRGAFLPILTPVIIMGGIWGGIFTPTEAAAVAAFYAMFLGVFVYREYGLRRLLKEIEGTLVDSAVIMLIIAFTSAFGVIMIRSGMPSDLAALMADITDNPTLLLFLMTLFWFVVGFFMAQTPAILILTPILLPTVEQFGVDPIHFGVVMTLSLTIGLLTPPVGMVLYALVRVTELSFERLVSVSFPYVAITFVIVALLIVFPDLVLFLPRLLS